MALPTSTTSCPAAANGLLPPLGYRRAEVAVEERAAGLEQLQQLPTVIELGRPVRQQWQRGQPWAVEAGEQREPLAEERAQHDVDELGAGLAVAGVHGEGRYLHGATTEMHERHRPTRVRPFSLSPIREAQGPTVRR
jgi:hypothetical protein